MPKLHFDARWRSKTTPNPAPFSAPNKLVLVLICQASLAWLAAQRPTRPHHCYAAPPQQCYAEPEGDVLEQAVVSHLFLIFCRAFSGTYELPEYCFKERCLYVHCRFLHPLRRYWLTATSNCRTGVLPSLKTACAMRSFKSFPDGVEESTF